MLKAGLWTLAALMIFALVFALLPGSQQEGTATGARLSGVSLALYPSRDPDAVWRFQASEVTSDPVAGETRLDGLSDGQRLLRQKDSAGLYTGQEVLDATLDAPELLIDGQDNLTTSQARITLVSQCAELDLSGSAERPVKVEQGYGFSAPVALLRSPELEGRITRLRMSFQFQIEDSGEDSQIQAPLDPTERCEDGRRVPLPSQT